MLTTGDWGSLTAKVMGAALAIDDAPAALVFLHSKIYGGSFEPAWFSAPPI